MNLTKRIGIALALVMCFIPTWVFGAELTTEEQGNPIVTIESFEASPVSGVDDNLEWNASKSGHEITFGVEYALNSEEEIAPGEVEIRVPDSILKDKNREIADTYKVTFPEYEKALKAVKEQKAKGEEAVLPTCDFEVGVADGLLVLRNTESLPVGYRGYFEVKYTAQIPSSECAPESDDFYAEMNILHGEETTNGETEPLKVFAIESEQGEEEQAVSFSEEKEIDGINVKVEAEEGVFPEGATLSVDKANKKEEKQVLKSVDKVADVETMVADSHTFDIKVLDKDGSEIQPNGEVKVSFSGELVENGNLNTNVYHTSGKKTEELPGKTKGDTFTTVSDGFSWYTVEFTYDKKTYVMDGDTTIPLKNVLDYVGLSGEVEKVWGSNDKLFSFEKKNGKWYVSANDAFLSTEWMKVVIDGVEYHIVVTDATYTMTLKFHANGGTIASAPYYNSSTSKYYKLLSSLVSQSDTSGGTYANVTHALSSTATYANILNVGTSNLKKTGYHIDGDKAWNTAADGSGVDVNQNNTAAGDTNPVTTKRLNGGTQITANVTKTLYANWQPNNYTVNYNANGGTGTTASSTHTYGTAKSLTANGFTKDKYVFKGWNTEADGSGTSYGNRAAVTNLTATNGGTVNLYAQWTDTGSGTFHGVWWEVDENHVLHIGKPGQTYTMTYSGTERSWPWKDYYVTDVVVEGTVNARGNIDRMFANMVHTDSIESIDLTGLNTAQAESMKGMFQNCHALTDITFGSGFNTSNVTDMSGMFFDCRALTELDVSSFDTSAVTNMSGMFQSCSKLGYLDMSSFDTSSVNNMQNMFGSDNKLTKIVLGTDTTLNNAGHPLTGWDRIVDGAPDGTTINTLSNYNPAKPGLYDADWNPPVYAVYDSTDGSLKIFTDFENTYTNEQVIGTKTYYVVDTTAARCVITSHVSDVTSVEVVSNGIRPTTMRNWFNAFHNVTSIDLSKLDTSNVTDMQGTFYDCPKLKTLDISNFNTSKVTNMYGTFAGCTSLESLDLSHFDTSKVTNMKRMFDICTSLKTLDIRNFDTSKVETQSFLIDANSREPYDCVLFGCKSLDTLYLGPNTIFTMGANLPVTDWTRIETLSGESVSGPTFTNIEDYDGTAGKYIGPHKIEVWSGDTLKWVGNDLQDAVDASANGDTIKLLDNITSGTVTVNKKVSIVGVDENRQILRDYKQTHDSLFVIGNGGELTLGGNIQVRERDADSESYRPNSIESHGIFVTVNDGGKLILSGGRIGYSQFSKGNVKDGTGYTAPVYANGGDVEIKSGHIAWNYLVSVSGNLHFVGAIFADNGSEIAIEGGTIQKNVGNIGAVYLTGGSTMNMNGGKIQNNSAIATNNPAYAGGVYVTDGSVFTLEDGELTGNHTSGKGGAVFVSEWDPVLGEAPNIDWTPWRQKKLPICNNANAKVSPGEFIMLGGSITGNSADKHGGAINVQSNNVTLLDGEISGNSSKTLGGGIYVEGDSPDFSYTLHLENASITSNAARPTGTFDSWVYENGRSVGGGTGGGIWTCPVGGSAIINAQNDNVLIDGNTATHKGTDAFSAGGYGVTSLKNLSGTWMDELTGDSVVEGDYSGKVALTNGASGADITDVTTGIKIFNNTAMHGGGVAANGTLLFGQPKNIYRYTSKMQVRKTWQTPSTEPITLKMEYDDGTDKQALDEFTVTLDGQADNDTSESGSAGEGTPTDSKNWNATFYIPQSIVINGVEKPCYTFVDPDNPSGSLSPINETHLAQMSDILSNGGQLQIKDWYLNIIEGTDNYIYQAGSVSVDTDFAQTTSVLTDPVNGGAQTTFHTNFIDSVMSQTVTNKPEGVVINKEDVNNKPLPGAQFTIVGNGINKTVTTGDNGRARLGLPAGTYTVTEIKAPLGYILDATPQTVVIVDDEETLTFVNEDNPYDDLTPKGKIKINKTDRDTDESLSGVVFGIYEKDEHGNHVKINEVTTNSRGYAEFELPKGDYFVKELSTQNGYVLDEIYHTANIVPDGTWVQNVPNTDLAVNKNSDDMYIMTGKLDGTEYRIPVYPILMTHYPVGEGTGKYNRQLWNTAPNLNNSGPNGLIRGLEALLAAGYPNNIKGIQEKYSLTDPQFYKVTELAFRQVLNQNNVDRASSPSLDAYDELVAYAGDVINDYSILTADIGQDISQDRNNLFIYWPTSPSANSRLIAAMNLDLAYAELNLTNEKERYSLTVNKTVNGRTTDKEFAFSGEISGLKPNAYYLHDVNVDNVEEVITSAYQAQNGEHQYVETTLYSDGQPLLDEFGNEIKTWYGRYITDTIAASSRTGYVTIQQDVNWHKIEDNVWVPTILWPDGTINQRQNVAALYPKSQVDLPSYYDEIEEYEVEGKTDLQALFITHTTVKRGYRANGSGVAELEFTLKSGESATFDNIPHGATVSISETAYEDYITSAVAKDSDDETIGTSDTGEISVNMTGNRIITVTNADVPGNELPDAGAGGIGYIIMIGFMLITVAGIMCVIRKRKSLIE